MLIGQKLTIPLLLRLCTVFLVLNTSALCPLFLLLPQFGHSVDVVFDALWSMNDKRLHKNDNTSVNSIIYYLLFHAIEQREAHLSKELKNPMVLWTTSTIQVRH